ncbi:MAG: proton-conducting membrane transporter [Sandaracinus sp.]|nr:proton-conducting membrane transporter [Sandaracinus sp.]
MNLDVQTTLAWLAATTVLLPLASFGLVATLEVLGRTPDDRQLARLAKLTFSLTTVAGLAAAVVFAVEGFAPVHHVFGHWFGIGDPDADHYGFDLGVLVDATSLVYLVLTAVLSGTVGAFSLRYLEGERGAGRFFQLLMLFASGLSLLVVAESLDLLFVGWEIVGITSALLIAFYRERSGPVRHGLLAFAIYRVCDAALLAALVVLHHLAGSGALPDAFAATTSAAGATTLGLLLLFASLGKSAQFPFSGWLPRAMEGPTPSSAIFYGALSVHAGAYLLLRTAPLWESSTIVRAVVIGVGAMSALSGTLVGRAQTDAKSSLAYASVTQVGLIFVEIGLGWHTLALVHVVGHASLRTFELLRAPSLLLDHQQLEAQLGGRVPATGLHYERALPLGLRARLHRFALSRFGLDALASRLTFALTSFVAACDRVDRHLAAATDGRPAFEDEELPELALRTARRPTPPTHTSSETAEVSR